MHSHSSASKTRFTLSAKSFSGEYPHPHTKVIICSSMQETNDVLVQLHFDKRSYDPVDYECIDETDFWVVEEEAQGELDYDQLENMVEQEPSSQTQGLVDEDDDDSEFHLLSDRELDAYNTPMSQ
ncbi:hypothetical protein Tco_1491328 [Tanacetum coccineum]